MFKRLFIFFSFLLISSSVFARDIKPYIEGLITYNKIDDSTGKSIDRDFGDTYPYYAKNDNNIGYGVEIGIAELLPKVRLAGQFLQTNFDIKSEISPGITYLNGNSSGNGKNSVKLYMLNAYYDFDLSEKIIPFVGVGIGAADINHQEGKELALQGMIGAKYKINDQLYMGIKGSYINMNGGNFSTKDFPEWLFKIEDTKIYSGGVFVGYNF